MKLDIKFDTKIKVNLDYKKVVMAGLSVLLFINVVFFKYVEPPVALKRSSLSTEYKGLNREIVTTLNTIDTDMNIFKKIGFLKNQIRIEKRKLQIVKQSKVSVFKMSSILRTILIKSGVNVSYLGLSNISKAKNKIEYSFKINATDTLNNIVHLMDLIENYSGSIYIPSYSMKYKGDGLFNVSMLVNFVYVNLK